MVLILGQLNLSQKLQWCKFKLGTIKPSGVMELGVTVQGDNVTYCTTVYARVPANLQQLKYWSINVTKNNFDTYCFIGIQFVSANHYSNKFNLLDCRSPFSFCFLFFFAGPSCGVFWNCGESQWNHHQYCFKFKNRVTHWSCHNSLLKDAIFITWCSPTPFIHSRWIKFIISYFSNV